MDKEIQYRALGHYTEGLLKKYSNDRELTKYMFTGIFPNSPFEIKDSDVVFDIVENLSPLDHYGVVGLFNINWQARHAELRIFLWSKQGEGIGTDACKFIVDYAFNMLNLNKVWLGVNAEHEQAKACYHKAGFKDIGILRSEIFRNGRYYDVARMECIQQG